MNLESLRVLHDATDALEHAWPGGPHDLVHDLIREHLGEDSDTDREHEALQPAPDDTPEQREMLVKYELGFVIPVAPGDDVVEKFLECVQEWVAEGDPSLEESDLTITDVDNLTSGMRIRGEAGGWVPARTVQVVSWRYWNGDEVGGGGFDWWEIRQDEGALVNERFDHEVESWATVRSAVRLVNVRVPADLTGQDLTNYLDSMIDALEGTEASDNVELIRQVTSPGAEALALAALPPSDA